MSNITLIAAVADNNVIGNENTLPWSLPDDLKHFRSYTLNKIIVMGRKTFESIGMPLKHRLNLVMSTSMQSNAKIKVITTIQDAIFFAAGNELVVIGGAEIYKLFLPHAKTLLITHVHAEVPGDVYFPDIDPNIWEVTSSESHDSDENHQFAFTIKRYERIRN